MDIDIEINKHEIKPDTPSSESTETANREWRKRCIIQLFVTILVVAGAIFGLLSSGDPFNVNDLYIAIISALIGLYLPQPKLIENKNI